jgi:hypothetical protein
MVEEMAYAMTPNLAVNRTARKRCLRVPSALRAPAAGYLERYGPKGEQCTINKK